MIMQPSLFAREDTILGVCEGLGEELGVSSNFFRVVFALGLFWNPVGVIAAYLTLGIALAVFRRAFPLRHATQSTPPAEVAPVASNDEGVTFAEAA